MLTHRGRVTHICVSDLTSISSDNSLSPGRRQAIIRTNAGILLIRPLETNLSEILIKIWIFSFKKMGLKVSSAKWRPFCIGLNVLTKWSMWELILATNFGSPLQMVTKVGSQILATKFGFVPDRAGTHVKCNHDIWQVKNALRENHWWNRPSYFGYFHGQGTFGFPYLSHWSIEIQPKCAEISYDRFNIIWMREKLNFHWMWMMKKFSV